MEHRGVEQPLIPQSWLCLTLGMHNHIPHSHHTGKYFPLLTRRDVRDVLASDPWTRGASSCEPPLLAGPQGMGADLFLLQKAACIHPLDLQRTQRIRLGWKWPLQSHGVPMHERAAAPEQPQPTDTEPDIHMALQTNVIYIPPAQWSLLSLLLVWPCIFHLVELRIQTSAGTLDPSISLRKFVR